jgi:putative ABC transport system permease protein
MALPFLKKVIDGNISWRLKNMSTVVFENASKDYQDETVQYDVEIKLRASFTAEQVSDIHNVLRSAQNIDTMMAFSVYAYGKNGHVQSPYLVVLGDEQKSLNFTDIDGNTVRMPEDGVLITPRMAKALGAQIGDVLTVHRIDGVEFYLKVAGIVNFPAGNEIYMGNMAFSKISDTPPLVKGFLITGNGFDLGKLKSDPRISLIETKEEMRDNMQAVLEALQSFQIMLIVFSGLLAFAVMKEKACKP